MKFDMPKDLSTVEDIAALIALALDESTVLAAIDDEKFTDEDLDRIEFLAASVATLKGESETREATAAARTERIAAAKSAVESATAGPEEEIEEDTEEVIPEEPVDETPLDVEIPDDASSITERESVTASAGTTSNSSVARRLAAKAPKVEAPEPVKRLRASLVASVDAGGFAAGSEIPDMKGAALAFLDRISGFPTERMAGFSAKNSVMRITKKVAPEFQLVRGQTEQNSEKIANAAKAFSLDSGSLVAAGGWCAPSETVYNMVTLETVSGILQIPEVTIAHGGINFTKGPDFSDIYTATGWSYTEAQVIANSAKNFMDVQCPPFTEVRMEAVGFGVRAGLLTRSAWPELVQRYLEGALVAHAHKVNASKINRIAVMAGTAINANERGSATVDTLNALAQQAERLRYKFRLDHSAVIEGFAPAWLVEVFRADLAYQNGVDRMLVTDAQINQWLAVRKVSLQWVYDYQDLSATGIEYPGTVDIILYPKGTYVAGTTDVINLDAVYDTASLTVNTFTAAFFEEGLMVFNPSANGVKVQLAIPISNINGRTGPQDLSPVLKTYV